MKTLLFVTAIIFARLTLANGGVETEAGSEHGAIPLKDIGLQALNLGILLAALFYFTKDSIKQHFINRKLEFVAKSEKTKTALQQAELALAGVKAKLNSLEAGEKTAIEKAGSEASRVKSAMIKETEAQAIKLKEDSKMSLNAELDKAKREIGETILNGAIAATTRKISDQKIQATKESESEFLRQVGQVKA